MNLIVVNDPSLLRWQTNLFDLTMLTMFVMALTYSVVAFRRGRRIYGVVLTAATIYGLVLELAGMATRYIFVQAVGLLIVCSLTLFPWFARDGIWPGRS